MCFIIATIFDQIVKYFVETTKSEIKIIDNIFNITYAQNTRWNIWDVSR